MSKPLEPTYEQVNAAYERYRKKGRKVSKEVLFRGQLKSVMERFIGEHALVRPSQTAKYVKMYHILTAFGLINDQLIENHATNQQKVDYLKVLPSDGFFNLSISPD